MPPKDSMFTKLRASSLNIRTLKDDMKLVDLAINGTKLKHDFITLQETHRPGCGDEKITGDQTKHLNGWRFIWSGFKKKANAGVGILMSRFCEHIETKVILPGRIILVKLIVRGQKIAAISAHAPDESYSEAVKADFWSKLSKTLKNDISNPWNLFCGGDFNATIVPAPQASAFGFGPVCDPACYDRAQETTFNGDSLLDLLRDHKVYLENTFFPTKLPAHQWTFRSANSMKYTRRLDYVIVDDYLHRYSSNCRAYDPHIKTDHRMLVLNAKVPKSRFRKILKENKKKPLSDPPLDYKLLIENDAVCDSFAFAVDDQLRKMEVDKNCIEAVNSALVQSLQLASEIGFSRREKEVVRKILG